MANDLNNGAQRLVERILADAQADAQQIAQQAQAEQDKVKELADQQIKKLQLEQQQQAKKNAESIIERSRTNAQLAARKEALLAKRQLIQVAFDQAFEQLCALGGQQRQDLLRSLALGEAAGGETIAPAKADQENMEGLLAAINSALAKEGKAPVKLGQPAPDIQGGFLLLGKGFEKDCSFEAVLHSVREQEETKVAQILFG